MSRLYYSRPWLISSVTAASAALLALAGCQDRTTSVPQEKTVAKTAPAPTPAPQANDAVAQFHKIVEPILRERCYDCHGDGESRANVAFDKLTNEHIANDPQFWLKVLNNTRANIMPPVKANNPLTDTERVALETWIKNGAFALNPTQNDPGRVTVHRLNRSEYQNTIRDLLGIDFDTESEFPGDDSGYGFDNIADVLNMSPLLMEKYLAAAQAIVDQAVPSFTSQPGLVVAGVRDFVYPDGTPTTGTNIRASGIGAAGIPAIPFSYLKQSSVSHTFKVTQAGSYNVVLEQNFRGDFVFTKQRATITVTIDGKQVSQNEYGWAGNEDIDNTYKVQWEPGNHTVVVAIDPVLPLQGRGGAGNDNVYNLKKLRLEGPMEPAKWVHPPNYARFFSRDTVPTDAVERRAYAKELLAAFATKAFRRPAPAESVDQLVEIAEKLYTTPGNTFETGIKNAMVAVLSSPRFLYRVENPVTTTERYALVDEYSLASRLSYFLWSTMPDDELLKLAAAGQLRTNLNAQVKRMLADQRSSSFMENFTGQWLQTRLVSTVPMNPREIFRRQGLDINPALTDEMRESVRQEPVKYFEYVVRENRSVDEFLVSDYTFINGTMATYYGGFPGVTGPEFRKVSLEPGDMRGGLLTTAGVLMVTSNPTRTSPVKRGKWILDNILGAPTPPPPPNVAALEDTKPKDPNHVPTLRETLAQHREDAMCASCHDRMDPLGLALDNFNALGLTRTVDVGQPIDTSGKLVSGAEFADVRDLKKILSTTHKREFYRTLTEKLLTYALGRGPEYYDVPTVDKIVADLERNHGAFSALLMGVIESVPFQQQRTFPTPPANRTPAQPKLANLSNP